MMFRKLSKITIFFLLLLYIIPSFQNEINGTSNPEEPLLDKIQNNNPESVVQNITGSENILDKLGRERLNGTGSEIIVNDTQLMQLLEDMIEGEFYLVKFFAPWCEYSRLLEPNYSFIAKAFPSLPVLSLNAYQHTKLNSRYGIYGFPRILLFFGENNFTRYHGIRSFENISKFVQNCTKLEASETQETIPRNIEKQIPEMDFYLYLSSIFLIALTAHSIWIFMKSDNQNERLKQD